MRRQIGFEIRDMWYNLGNLTNSLCRYCSVSLVKNENCYSFFLNEFADEDQSEPAVERQQSTRVKVLFSQCLFMIICQLSALTLITSQPRKEQQLNIDNHVLISFMVCGVVREAQQSQWNEIVVRGLGS